MPFTVADFHDLLELLEEQPQWQKELRRVVLTDDLLDLPKVVQELAEAQQRTERRVEELAKAQQELTEAQQRTEEALQATRREVGRLSAVMGSSLEEEAADILAVVLEDEGFRLLGEELNVRFNGDVDVAIPAESSSGERLTAVIESKTRLGSRAVRAFASRVASDGFKEAMEKECLPGPFRAYVYGMRVDSRARRTAEEIGIGLLSTRGQLSAPRGSFSGC